MVLRLTPSLKRWGDIVLLSVAGAATTAVLAAILFRKPEKITLAKDLAVPGAVLLVLMVLPWAWRHRRAWFGVKNLRYYPPAWLAIFPGFALLLLFWSLVPPAFLTSGDIQSGNWEILAAARPWFLGAVGGFLLVVAAGVLWPKATGSRKAPSQGVGENGSPSEAKTGEGTTELTFKELIGWICIDDEIREPSHDRFGHDAIARRIVRRLDAENGDSPAPSIAVVGRRGSGKTSLGNLVRWHLEQQGFRGNSILFVPVSLWPYETSVAAVRGILQELIDALTPHVNTSGLSTLPAHYVEAVSRSGGWYSALGALLHQQRSPDEVLGSVEAIAQALDLRIVLWVEDLERFTGAPTDGSPNDTGSGEERLGPIRSLLHLLDRKDRITVIMAAENLDTPFDMEKIVRFVEPMPSLPVKAAGDLIERFRRRCLDESDEWIDAYRARPERLLEEFSDFLEMFPNTGLPIMDYNHLMTLCATPRRLKMALRATLDVWKPLVGEIDFDDVLLMSMLRETEPDVISLVDRHIDQLREGWEPDGENKSDQDCPFDKALDELLSKGKSEATRKAVRTVLRRVFGNWHEKRNQASIKRPQGFLSTGHADYWYRFLAVPELAEDECDQPVLLEMRRWEEDRTGKLPTLVADRERSLAVEDLSTYLSPEGAVALLERIIEDRAGESPRMWPPGELSRPDPPGIVPVWRILRRMHLDDELRNSLLSVIEASIRRYTAHNMALVRELMAFFITRETASDHGIQPILKSEMIHRLRESLDETIATLGKDQILTSLREAFPWVLFHCAWGLDRIRDNDLHPPPFEGWEAFSNRILDAVEQGPFTIIPQLVPFVVKEDGGRVIFDESMAEQLFDMDRLVDLLRHHPIPEDEVPEAIRERYRVLMAALG